MVGRVVEPAVLRLCQWRGDPVARLMLPATKADPYPLYARLALAELEPWIREVTVRLLAADGADGFDLIDALAFPLPIAVICHLLGVPAEDQAQFRVWGHDVAATLDPQTAAAQAQTRASERALTGYLRCWCCAGSRAFSSAPGRWHRRPPLSVGRINHSPWQAMTAKISR